MRVCLVGLTGSEESVRRSRFLTWSKLTGGRGLHSSRTTVRAVSSHELLHRAVHLLTTAVALRVLTEVLERFHEFLSHNTSWL